MQRNKIVEKFDKICLMFGLLNHGKQMFLLALFVH